ncbi:hypothetical protein RhiirA4_467729 [Rhizophagus irregularis]|uniref:Uncharacterized protein n=1 Tax=Rhizophagus irregularis TaxID=588596 RepID=A0A2I1GWF1_9GLOM|nr:hypothetical protein RhiirA4_467729 [Rhizophagus irregularis]
MFGLANGFCDQNPEQSEMNWPKCLLNGKTKKKFEVLETRLRNKSKHKELIPIIIEHAKMYYEDREIVLFKNKHELIHYFRQRKKEISVNDQTFKDFKGKLEA